MTWLTPQINQRVQILKPRQVPNNDGGLDFCFGTPVNEAFESGSFDSLAPLMTVWMGVKPVGFKGSGRKYIRGEQVSEVVTHEFTLRNEEIASLGKEFDSAFGLDFKGMADLCPLKSDYFLQLERYTAVKGRLFRIDSLKNVGENEEYLSIAAEEIESRGAGAPF